MGDRQFYQKTVAAKFMFNTLLRIPKQKADEKNPVQGTGLKPAKCGWRRRRCSRLRKCDASLLGFGLGSLLALGSSGRSGAYGLDGGVGGSSDVGFGDFSDLLGSLADAVVSRVGGSDG